MGDAISHEALILQKYLHDHGHKSQIFSQHFGEQNAHRVRHYKEYKSNSRSILIYHHSFYSGFLHQLPDIKARKMLIYHNTTPVRFVRPYNIQIAEQLDQTNKLLEGFHDLFTVKLAASAYNAKELGKLGFEDIQILPVPLQPLPSECQTDLEVDKSFMSDGKHNILFVGRVFPNKRHQDLIKAFYYYQKLQPDSRLCIVGDFHPGMKGYTAELVNLAQALGIRKKVLFTGMVSAEKLRLYYKNSDLFLSMSEHEGFFVPLIECMKMELPILAYTSSVVPETLNNSGVQFCRKDFPRIALMMQEMIENKAFRKAILESQRKRLNDFPIENTLNGFNQALASMGIDNMNKVKQST